MLSALLQSRTEGEEVIQYYIIVCCIIIIIMIYIYIYIHTYIHFRPRAAGSFRPLITNTITNVIISFPLDDDYYHY